MVKNILILLVIAAAFVIVLFSEMGILNKILSLVVLGAGALVMITSLYTGNQKK
jgi:hypothetical protein